MKSVKRTSCEGTKYEKANIGSDCGSGRVDFDYRDRDFYGCMRMDVYKIASDVLKQSVLLTWHGPGDMEAVCADGTKYSREECMELVRRGGTIDPTVHAIKKAFNGTIVPLDEYIRNKNRRST